MNVRNEKKRELRGIDVPSSERDRGCVIVMMGWWERREKMGVMWWEGEDELAELAIKEERVGKKSELLLCVMCVLSLTFLDFWDCNSGRERKRMNEWNIDDDDDDDGEIEEEMKRNWF